MFLRLSTDCCYWKAAAAGWCRNMVWVEEKSKQNIIRHVGLQSVVLKRQPGRQCMQMDCWWSLVACAKCFSSRLNTHRWSIVPTPDPGGDRQWCKKPLIFNWRLLKVYCDHSATCGSGSTAESRISVQSNGEQRLRFWFRHPVSDKFIVGNPSEERKTNWGNSC